jgi:hypothetical protein
MAVIIPPAAKNLTRSKFLGKDFDTYVQEITQYMQLQFDPTTFNNFFASELGVMLVETVAYALSQASWYIDRQVGENFLETAVLRNSVARLCRQIGFRMTGAVAPSVDLEVSFAAPQAFNVEIPKGFEYQSSSGLIYQQTADLIFTAGEVGPKVVTVIQGETREEFFVSDGTANQIFQLRNILSGEFIAEGTSVVSIDNVIWEPQDFLTFDQTNQYEVELNREPPQIRFGDGFAGNIPPNGADIRVSYVTTKGTAGKVLAGEITQPRAPLVVGVDEIPLVINNPLASTAGGEAMALSEARVLAPQVFSTAKRLVTKEDYDAVVNAFVDPIFGRVAIGGANIVRSFLDDNYFVQDLENLNTLCGYVQAQLVAHSTSANGNVTYTAKPVGAAGNTIQVAQQNNGVSLPLVVSVVGQDITIQLATNGLGVVTSTANDVVTAVQASVAANALVNVVAEGTGAGLAGVLASLTALSGGGDNTAVQNIIKFDTLTPPATWGTLPQQFDEIYSAACKANLVEVQILAADSSGRYIAPTVGLAQALKAELETMKESTVQILVFDGSRNLFSVNAAVAIKVIDGYDSVVVSNNVKLGVEDHLLNRKYGESIRISDVYAIVEAVEGVKYSHVNFTVPTAPTKVDPATGDVLIDEDEVVTLGTVTVSLI